MNCRLVCSPRDSRLPRHRPACRSTTMPGPTHARSKPRTPQGRLRTRQLRVRPDREPRRRAQPLAGADRDDLAEPPHAPRRDRRRRQDRRRLRTAAEDARRSSCAPWPPRRASSSRRCSPPGWSSCRPIRALAAAARATLGAQLARQGLELAGWRVVPIGREACGAQALRSLPLIEQVFVNCRVAAARRGRVQPPAVHGAAPRREGARRGPGVLHAEPLRQHHRLQGHGDAAVPGAVLPGPGRPAPREPRWPCSTSASPPTRCRSGAWRIRTATSPTTARSTPSRATATGRPRAARCCRPRCCRILPRRCRWSARAARTRRASTTCSRCCCMGGLDPLHAMRLLMPPAWHGLDTLDPDLRAFYEYYSVHMEPWDGPAGRGADGRPLRAVHARSQRPAPGALLHHAATAASRSPRRPACGTTRPRTWCARASSGPAT